MLYESTMPLVGSGGSQVMVILALVTMVEVTFLGADGAAMIVINIWIDFRTRLVCF